MTYAVVGIGTSWGGLAAMTKLLGSLPGDFNLPVVVVQHRGKDSDRLLSELLQDATDMKVCEVEDKEPLESGTVHIAPANYHVLIDAGYLSLTVEEPVRFSRPSIDVMFSSAADTYGSGAIGVVLTGANEDGARGLSHIVKRGGRALVQDPKTAEIPIMPVAAIKAVPSAEVLPLDGLAPRLIELSLERRQAGVRKAV
ncbi:MAG: two-component system, chemotaxis family, protein-glutamate methylesterase/glutaminase [Gemmatimonadaceae bacterium]|jgi:two-component system chemotaxis response regulator CheB|nr:two-component system, chemotaxis family, protein-glutamate methylesterase/glutaminase [Gemmatimonadaceae bacterium]